MRIWAEQLIPKLCRQHLLAMWHEGLILYSIITTNGRGWKNTPMRKEFEDAPFSLWLILQQVREEMIKRSYHPKPMPELECFTNGFTKPWQSLEKQIEVLKAKGCKCKV